MGRFGQIDLRASKGQQKTFVLPDGTRADLVGPAEIDLAFTAKARLARLERGTVTFRVSHDPARPFRIAAGGRVVSDIGTVFRLDRKEAGIHLRLYEGSVTVTRGDDPAAPSSSGALQLKAGQELETRADGTDVVSIHSDDAPEAMPARLTFRNEALGAAASTMNQTSPNQLIVDPRLRDHRISGGFRSGDAAGFAQSLADLYPIAVRKQPDGSILLLPRESR
jgi:transmembrane sensor